MNCPKCPSQLLISDKHGVEIDYCPNCRGIWLDRGELDKIIERESMMNSQNSNYKYKNKRDDDDYHDSDYDNNRNKFAPNHQKRKGGFLSDLFDF